MLRVSLVVLVLASFAHAQVAATQPSAAPPARVPVAATRPATTRFATSQPTPAELRELHRQAVELMRQGQFAKAVPPMAKVYKALPPEEQNRAVIVNQAILDLTQKTTAVRGLRDLSRYLIKHRDPDETATNVLGSLLDLTADMQRVKDGAIWQEAYREWNRRNYVLEKSVPDGHRWGVKWLTAAEYEALEKQKADLEQQKQTLFADLERATWRVNALTDQYNAAANEAIAFGGHAHDPRLHGPSGQCPLCGNQLRSYAEVSRLSAQVVGEQRELSGIRTKYDQVTKRTIKPPWPGRYEPVEPE
jgi:hypothetical protein